MKPVAMEPGAMNPVQPANTHTGVCQRAAHSTALTANHCHEMFCCESWRSMLLHENVELKL